MTEHYDVVVVGAGLSGIAAGYHLQTKCPGRRYVILEGRGQIGGTWDLFRYPGVRSDSDMYTLGYGFRPWSEAKSIADGPAILHYLRETAADHRIHRNIRFRQQVKTASWSTAEARWTVTTTDGDGRVVSYSCDFLFLCSGYYDYARGYTPDFAGAAEFAGRIVHPQFWPADLDYAGKRVVVIGSGATAVTLVPELAKTAAHVTMLQRSPTYIVARPAEDGVANWLRGTLPAKLAHFIARWKNVLLGMFFFRLARRKPGEVKARLIEMVRQELGPDYDVATHFTPRYNPWDQRLCLVPDGDLFAAVREGRAAMVTDRIARFEADGVRLESGALLPAEIVVTATGLELQLLSGIAFAVDGVAKDLSRSLNYKGLMYSDIPNLASSFGYTNASWTLKAELTCGYVCRLLNAMAKRGMRQVTPRVTGAVAEEPFLAFTSGYVQRGIDRFPRQGNVKPWKLHQNYLRDIVSMRFGAVGEGVEFSNPVQSG